MCTKSVKTVHQSIPSDTSQTAAFNLTSTNTNYFYLYSLAFRMLLKLIVLLVSVARALPPLPWIENLNRYGCWCDFSETRFRGMLNGTNGKTVDEYDFVCKILIFDYYEGKNNIKSCEPWKIRYKSPREAGNDWNESCRTANDHDSCKAHACASENKFMNNIMSLNMRKVPVFDGYRLRRGFNETEVCKKVPKVKDVLENKVSGSQKLVVGLFFVLVLSIN